MYKPSFDIFWFLFCKFLGVGFLGYMVSIGLTLEETDKPFSREVVLFYSN